MTASEPVERQIEVAIYAARTTDKAAAEHFGIARRTVTNIRNRWRDSVEFRIAWARLSAKLGDQYVDLEQLAIERGRTALLDPKTSPRDIAAIGKWASEQRALSTGDVTSRTEATVARQPELTWDEEESLRLFAERILETPDDELKAWAADGGLAAIRDGESNAKAVLAAQEDTDGMG